MGEGCRIRWRLFSGTKTAQKTSKYFCFYPMIKRHKCVYLLRTSPHTMLNKSDFDWSSPHNCGRFQISRRTRNLARTFRKVNSLYMGIAKCGESYFDIIFHWGHLFYPCLMPKCGRTHCVMVVLQWYPRYTWNMSDYGEPKFRHDSSRRPLILVIPRVGMPGVAFRHGLHARSFSSILVQLKLTSLFLPYRLPNAQKPPIDITIVEGMYTLSLSLLLAQPGVT